MNLADDLLAGVPAIAQYIGKTERAAYHLIYNDQLPHFKIGRRIHARRTELDAALRAPNSN